MSILKVQEIQHTNATSALTISTGGNVTVPSGDLIVDTNTLVVDASANKVGIGTASPATAELDVSGKIRASSGMLFGTDTADANLLDDYEQGTFTPTGSAPSGSFTSQEGSGFYTKVGDQVFVYGYIKITNVGTGSGGMNFAGFPFAGSNRSFPAGNRSGLLSMREDQRTGTFMHMFLNAAATSGGINMGSHTVTNNDTFIFSGVYHTG